MFLQLFILCLTRNFLHKNRVVVANNSFIIIVGNLGPDYMENLSPDSLTNANKDELSITCRNFQPGLKFPARSAPSGLGFSARPNGLKFCI